MTAIAYAALHPERVSHLVLSAPIARGTLRRPSASPGEKERFRAFVKLVELGWDAENPAFRQVETTQMFPRATPVQLAELNELFRISAPAPQAARMVQATGEADVSELLPRVACPVLVMHVRGAALMPVEEARLIASSVQQARFVQLEANNYMPIEGEPGHDQHAHLRQRDRGKMRGRLEDAAKAGHELVLVAHDQLDLGPVDPRPGDLRRRHHVEQAARIGLVGRARVEPHDPVRRQPLERAQQVRSHAPVRFGACALRHVLARGAQALARRGLHGRHIA